MKCSRTHTLRKLKHLHFVDANAYKAMAIISVDGQNASGAKSDATSGGVDFGGVVGGPDAIVVRFWLGILPCGHVFIKTMTPWHLLCPHSMDLRKGNHLFKKVEKCLQYILIFSFGIAILIPASQILKQRTWPTQAYPDYIYVYIST